MHYMRRYFRFWHDFTRAIVCSTIWKHKGGEGGFFIYLWYLEGIVQPVLAWKNGR